MASDDAREISRTHHLVVVLLASSVAVFLVAEALSFETEFLGNAAPSPVIVEKYTKITIDFGDGTKRAFRGNTETGMTAMVALRAAQAAGGLRVETDAEGAVVRINATHTDDTHVWRLYRNGSLVPGVLGRVMIDPGDILLLRYERE